MLSELVPTPGLKPSVRPSLPLLPIRSIGPRNLVAEPGQQSIRRLRLLALDAIEDLHQRDPIAFRHRSLLADRAILLPKHQPSSGAFSAALA